MSGVIRVFGVIAALLMFLSMVPSLASQVLVDAPVFSPSPYRIWRSSPPDDCPFLQSKAVKGIGFTGRHAEYTNADTWYPSWASDGNMYSPFTDGDVHGVGSFSIGGSATTGFAKIVGDNPLKLKIEGPANYVSSSLPYKGRYPCGSLVYNGVWYYGTYCLDEEMEPGYNLGILGPFVGFRYSTDYGKTWTQTPHTPEKPLFPETGKNGGKIKIGSPHFVDFGQNMQYSPDGKAYLVAHGASDPDPKPRPANLSWITGDQIYLIRVAPGIENMNDASKYEFFGGNDAKGDPIWTGDFKKIKPLIEWNNHCGCVTMTYNPALKKYLMCITDGWPTVKTMDTYILESDKMAGPWRMVTYMRRFGTQGYFVNFPSKFISKDGRTAWLCYAANFIGRQSSNPPGSRYAMCLQEVKLLSPSDAMPPETALESSDNIARIATVSTSSTINDYHPLGAVDGIVGGYPGSSSHEWASNGETNTGMLRLDWEEEQVVDKVWLFDRPNTNADQVTSGVLIFSDGSTIPFGPLPDDAKKGVEITFKPKRIKWLICAITACKSESKNIGFSEVAVFRSKTR